jgi:hypothetical protein
MRYSGRIRNSLFSILLLSLLLITSCIDESHDMCMQYAVTAHLVDKNGKTLPDSTVDSVKAYLFIDDKFDHAVTPESDGYYLVSFDKSSTMNLVLIGLPEKDSLNISTPSRSDDIGSISVSALESSSKGAASGDYVLPSRLYYGRFDYLPDSTSTGSGSAVVTMTNKPVTLHVVVEELLDIYGEGSYSVVLSGLHDAVAFDGSVTGDSITCTPEMSFDSKENLCSGAFHTFPTKSGESVTVSIYKGGLLMWQSSEDYLGNSITLSGGDDKCIIVDVGSRNLSLQVMPWSEYLQQSTTLY